jgi:alpha/beta superfamily hydrolase
MEQSFFGPHESQLFRVFHSARGKQRQTTRAVLICSPIGQEYIRTHWSLRLLANQLTRNGIAVMRFDYSGIGDSAGSSEQIATVDQWKADIELAIEELKLQSGTQTVMLLGQRFGGWLAAEVAKQRPDVNALVCLEPVSNGKEYLQTLRRMHHQMLDLWVCKVQTPNHEFFEEILGSQFRRSLLNEIEDSRLDLSTVRQPQLIVATKLERTKFSHPVDGLQKVIVDGRESTWHDLRELETASLRPEITRTIVKTVDDMFQRLERLDALELLMEDV